MSATITREEVRTARATAERVRPDLPRHVESIACRVLGCPFQHVDGKVLCGIHSEMEEIKGVRETST